MTQQGDRAAARGLLSILAETSVHAGTGAQLGAVDLPIQRERHTGWPTIHGTGLKGVFRDHAQAEGWTSHEIAAVFGPETRPGERDAERHSGALAISDARLLLFPVRTLGPAFAWITCPLALARLRRDVAQARVAPLPEVDEPATAARAVVSDRWPDAGSGLLLEEFSYETTVSPSLARLGKWIADQLLPGADVYAYWKEMSQQAVVLVPDDDFRDFVTHGTEVVTRVRLASDGSKRVEKHALWTEENLPADALLYSFVSAWRPVRIVESGLEDAGAVLSKLAELVRQVPVIQVGGKETVGRGFVAVTLVGGDHGEA